MKARKQAVVLAQVHELSEEFVLDVLKKSFSHHKTNRATKHEPTIELAREILGRLRGFQDTLYPVFEQFGRYPRLIVLDHGKKSRTAINIKVLDKATGRVVRRRIRENWGTENVLEIVRRLLDRRNYNLGVELGDVGDGKSYLVVLDIDIKDPVRQQLLLSRLGKRTLLIRTPSRKGLQVWFWSSKCIPGSSAWGHGKAEVDVKGKVGYVLCPGTWFQDKGLYAYDWQNEWFDLKIAELPQNWESILDELLPSTLEETEGEALCKLGERTHRVDVLSPSVASPSEGVALIQRLKKLQGFELFEYARDGGLVPHGYRFEFCQRVAGYLEGHLHWEEDMVFEKLCEFRDSIFEDEESFGEKEVQRAVSWVFREEEQNRTHRVGLLSPRSHSRWIQYKTELSWCEREFVSLLLLTKDHSAGVRLSEVASLYREFAQLKTGRSFDKSIPRIVGQVLKLAGFSAKEVNARTLERKRTKINLWNVDLSLLRQELVLLENRPKSVVQEVQLLRNEFGRIKRANVPVSEPSEAPIEAEDDALVTLILPEPPTGSTEAPGAVLSPGTFNVRGSQCAATFDVRTEVNQIVNRKNADRTNETLDRVRASLFKPIVRTSEQVETDKQWKHAFDTEPEIDAQEVLQAFENLCAGLR